MSTTLGNGCPYCGAFMHTGMCPRIKSISYGEDGRIRHVELHSPNDVLRDPQGWPLIAPAPPATPPEGVPILVQPDSKYQRLRSALKFYADAGFDRGEIARQALASVDAVPGGGASPEGDTE